MSVNNFDINSLNGSLAEVICINSLKASLFDAICGEFLAAPDEVRKIGALLEGEPESSRAFARLVELNDKCRKAYLCASYYKESIRTKDGE